MKSPKPLRAMLALIALSLPLWISSCTSAPPKPVKTCPPATLQQVREIPAWTGTTWGHLAEWAGELAATIDELNADNRAAARFCNTPLPE